MNKLRVKIDKPIYLGIEKSCMSFDMIILNQDVVIKQIYVTWIHIALQ